MAQLLRDIIKTSKQTKKPCSAVAKKDGWLRIPVLFDVGIF